MTPGQLAAQPAATAHRLSPVSCSPRSFFMSINESFTRTIDAFIPAKGSFVYMNDAFIRTTQVPSPQSTSPVVYTNESIASTIDSFALASQLPCFHTLNLLTTSVTPLTCTKQVTAKIQNTSGKLKTRSPMPEIQRRKTVTAKIGQVRVGSDAPVVVQSMTNTDTADAPSTIQQVAELVEAGSELVRVTVNNDAAAKAVPHIVEGLAKRGINVPIIGDFHYNGHQLLKRYPACAQNLAKYRINPGNVSIGRKDDDNFRTMIECAVENQKPVRIGVNWGSLDQALLTRLMDENSKRPDPAPARDVMLEAMCRSALDSAAAAEHYGLRHDQIIISGKVSGVRDLIDVYQMLAARCNYPLHLGLTEAGMGMKGIVASTAGLAPLLLAGIGDTIRVSLTPKPGASRTEEVLTAQQVLQSLGIRSFTPQVTACRRRGTQARCDGLRRQRPRRIEARQHRHLAPRHLRRTESSRLCRRPPHDHSPRRHHRPGLQENPRRLCSYPVWLTRTGNSVGLKEAEPALSEAPSGAASNGTPGNTNSKPPPSGLAVTDSIRLAPLQK